MSSLEVDNCSMGVFRLQEYDKVKAPFCIQIIAYRKGTYIYIQMYFQEPVKRSTTHYAAELYPGNVTLTYLHIITWLLSNSIFM